MYVQVPGPKRDSSSALFINDLEVIVAKRNGHFVPLPWALGQVVAAATADQGCNFVSGLQMLIVGETIVTTRVPFWADMPPQFVENLSTSHVVGSVHWCTCVHRRDGSGRRAPASFSAFAHWQSSDPVKFVCYLIAALLASSLKVSLPGIEGTLSVNFLFTLLGILELSLPETLLIGLASTLGQFYWRPARQVKAGSAGLQSVAGHGFERGRVRRLQAGRDLCSARAGTTGSARGRHHPLRLQHGGDVDHHRPHRRQVDPEGLE